MPHNDRYARKISSEEARKGYIFILKDYLSFFPPRGKPFTLSEGEKAKEVYLESYSCTCRGPQLPHDHFFIRWEGVRFGDRITITRDEKAGGKYVISTKR